MLPPPTCPCATWSRRCPPDLPVGPQRASLGLHRLEQGRIFISFVVLQIKTQQGERSKAKAERRGSCA